MAEPLPSSSSSWGGGGGGGHWVVTGSSRGFLTLWDVRFQLPVHTWQHPMRCGLGCVGC